MPLTKEFCRSLARQSSSIIIQQILEQLASTPAEYQQRFVGPQYPFILALYETGKLAIIPAIFSGNKFIPIALNSAWSESDGAVPLPRHQTLEESDSSDDSDCETDEQVSALLVADPNNPAPNTEDFTHKRIPLNAHEAALLNQYAGIPIHHPRTMVPMKFTLGAVFALMVGLVLEDTTHWKDIMAAPILFIGAIMIVYPMIYWLWHYGVMRCRRPAIDFNLKDLMREGFNIAVLLLGALPLIPAADKAYPANDQFSTQTYCNAIVKGLCATAGFSITNVAQQFFNGLGDFTASKEAVHTWLTSILTPSIAFPALLALSTAVAQASGAKTPSEAADLTTTPGLASAMTTMFGLPAFYVSSHWAADKLTTLIIWLFMSIYRCFFGARSGDYSAMNP